ncbi:hypothetical protein ACJX0J_021371, partial [Zea mays]
AAASSHHGRSPAAPVVPDRGAGPRHPGAARPLRGGAQARAGAVRHHVPVHGAVHGRRLRLQVHRQAQAAHPRGRRRRAARDPDHAPPRRPQERRHHQGRLRGPALRPHRDGALRGRRALRPHRRQGVLLRAQGRRDRARHRRRRGGVPLAGRHAPGPQARELLAQGQGPRRVAQGHRLRPLRLLQARPGVHRRGGLPLLRGAGGAVQALRARGGRVDGGGHRVHPPQRGAAVLGGDAAGHLRRRAEGGHRLRLGAVAGHLRQRQGPDPPNAAVAAGGQAERAPGAVPPVDLRERGGPGQGAGPGGADAAEAVLGHEQAEEDGAAGHLAEPVGGGAGGAEGDVQGHGHGRQRRHHLRRAEGGAEEARVQGPQGERDQGPDGRRRRGQERQHRLRRVHRRHRAHEQAGARGAPARGIRLLRQGRQRIHHRRRAGAGVQGAQHGRRRPRRHHHRGGPGQ